MRPLAIEALDIVKRFEVDGTGLTALAGVTFGVGERQFVTLVGPSGCGKSTLLQILAGLMDCTEGEARIAGARIRGPSPAKVGVVFQESLLLPWKTALENVAFPLELQGIGERERGARAHALLELMELGAFADRYPGELSVGMRQRVSIARALVHDPGIVLMDEPFAALDEQTRTRMGHELLRIWTETGKTVLFVTHSLSEAIYLSDTVLVMSPRPGRILQSMDIDLPRPRTFEMMGSEAFGRTRNHIWRLIGESRP